MSKNDLVPLYYDGEDRRKPSSLLKTRADIKHEQRTGLLSGQYQENGTVFVQYRVSKPVSESESDAEVWVPRQSGYAGPLVLQMV